MSELALQLIAENKRTKNTFLDLGNCGLTQLPQELFDCVWLEELILDVNWSSDFFDIYVSVDGEYFINWVTLVKGRPTKD
jgi:hypothetical protein